MKLRATAPRLLGLFLVGFALVWAQVGYWTLLRGDELAGHSRNPRYWTRLRSTERGLITDRKGVDLARNRRVQNDQGAAGDLPLSKHQRFFARQYPGGATVSHVIGYSDWRRGEAGAELALKEFLAPPLGYDLRGNPWNLLAPLPRRGDDITLTLDWELQRFAQRELGQRAGAVVVIEVATGAIRAMVDWPTFDPAALGDETAWRALADDSKRHPLLPTAYAGLYPPGSTFKLLTAAAALDAGTATPDTEYYCGGTLALGHSTVRCDNLSGHGRISLARGIAASCNIALARAALALGGPKWQRVVLASGLTERARIFRPGGGTALVAAGQVPQDAALTKAELAACGYGQGALAVSPLYIASLGQMLANEGLRQEPYLVERITSDRGRLVYSHALEPGRQVVSTKAANQVMAMMRAVFEPGGTAYGLAEDSFAGKTGSAQNPTGRAHSWFVVVGPAQQPRYAVAAIVLNAGWGRTAAAPLAIDVLRAALKG